MAVIASGALFFSFSPKQQTKRRENNAIIASYTHSTQDKIPPENVAADLFPGDPTPTPVNTPKKKKQTEKGEKVLRLKKE
ncbi:hypothetical protein Ahy_B08g089155 isoform B [Arachis hypogaea]|uniref:Uncharacterized protein n=1 Tax=Arachis hypogaea TaxID=3818 RepID=A0A444XXL7_ARAHY|nr:hypothetical protein Ahy_B08g089155 isoform B [Arachis hypogaea]